MAYLSLLISLGATHRAGPNDFKMQPDVGRSEKLMNLTWVKKVVVLNFLLYLNLPKKISHEIKNRQSNKPYFQNLCMYTDLLMLNSGMSSFPCIV